MTSESPAHSRFAGLRPVAMQQRETPFAADMLHRGFFLDKSGSAVETRRLFALPFKGVSGGDGISPSRVYSAN